MSFFEPPPPPPEPPQVRREPWMGPPANVIGVVLPLALTLARTPDAAVAVTGVVAYPEGFELTAEARLRQRPDWRFDFPFHMELRRGSELPAEYLRFGIAFADGRKATNLGGSWPPPGSAPDLVIAPHGGGGGDRRWRQEYWVWPLPPPGTVAFVCEWPALGIPETQIEVDAEAIREAASRADVLWPGEADDDGDGSSSRKLVFGRE